MTARSVEVQGVVDRREGLPDWAYQMAPCLTSGPLSEAGAKAVAAALELGDGCGAWILRSWAVPKVFEWCEEIFREDLPPFDNLAKRLAVLADWFARARALRLSGREVGRVDHKISLEEFTGDHYATLFRAFDAGSFWKEPARILRQRLERNSILTEEFAGGKVLDAGCGGGRYAVAWRILGAGEVVGLDLSCEGVADAARRAGTGGVEGVRFLSGTVLTLPFPDGCFDVVFSNGVLHHTTDWRRGVRELVRVLRAGGLGWLYVIENPGGVFWDSIEILRAIMHGAPPEIARSTLRLLGIPPNRVFYMLDHVLVPINLRLRASEVEDALREAGAVKIRRLTRGCDYDRIEQIHRDVPHAAEKFGVGEHRYVFSK